MWSNSLWRVVLGWTLVAAGSLQAATVTWKAAVSGAWNDGSKWSSGAPPAATDTAVIDITGTYTVTVNTAVTVGGLTINPSGGRATLALSAGSFTLSGPGIVSTNGDLRLAPGGTLDGAGDLTVAGRFEWSGGQIQGAGKLILSPGSKASVIPGGQHNLRERRVVNGTTVEWTSPNPDYFGFGAVWENQAGSVLDMKTNFQIYFLGGTPAVFQNAGSFLKSGGPGQSILDVAVQNSSTATLQTGDVSFLRGFTQTAGKLQLLGGNYEGSPALLNIIGGTLEGAGRIATGVSIAGELRPGNPLGKLTISPNWNTTNTPTSRSYFQLGGTTAGVNYDQFFTAGGLNVGGELRLEFVNGFEPTGGDVFEIMRGTTRKGTFSATNSPVGFSAEVTYSTTNVTLRLIKTGVVPPQIISQPAAVAVNDGGSATFTVVATGSGLSYQWRRNAVDLPGANLATLTISPVKFSDAGNYDVIVSNSGGSETSTTAVLTVIPTSLEAGLLARYALDDSLVDSIGGRNGTVVGATTYVTNAARDRAFRFNASSYIALGTQPSEPIVNSAEAFSMSFWIRPRRIKEMVPVRLATPEGEFAVYLSSGNNGDFATHFGFRGHPGPATVDPRAAINSQVGCWIHVALVYRGGDKNSNGSYAAYFNGVSIPLPGNVSLTGGVGANELGRNISGANGYVDGDLDEVRIYERALRAEDATALAANPPTCPPEIIQAPIGLAVNPGVTAAFSVAAIGATPLTYEWRQNNTPLAGATTAILSIPNAQAVNIGTYTVVVGNAFGAVTSAPVILNLNTLPPVITLNPVSDAVAPGGTASFSVEALGTGITYQWLKNGLPISGATAASYALASVTRADDATYSVVVSNAAGPVRSAGATLDVLPPPDAEGMVARYPFDDSLADVLNGRSLNPVVSPAFGTKGPRGGWFVTRGGNYATLGAPDDPLLRVDRPFSVSYWFRHDSLQNVQPLVIGGFRGSAAVAFSADQPGSSYGAGVYALVTLGTNGTRFVCRDFRASLVTNLGCWTHVTLSFRGGDETNPANTELWINGERLSLSFSGASGSVGTTLISGPAANVFYPYVLGGVDELRVYQRALTAAEVVALAGGLPECPPEFASQPAGGAVLLGAPFTLSPTVIGRPSISYQWYKDGAVVSGATGLNYSGIASANAGGAYWLVASNRFGSTRSSNAVVNVVVLPPPGLATLNTGTGSLITGASFLNRLVGLISLQNGGVCLTTNGGVTWTPLNTGVTTALNAVQLIGGVGYIAGANGVICISTNSGSSWTPFNTGTSETFYGLAFENPASGWAVGGGGTICRYNGRAWVATPTGISVNCYGVAYGGSVPWAAGAVGTICRYVGGVWQAVDTGTSATFYGIAFRGANLGLAVGGGGTICRYNGVAWVPVNSGTTATIRSVVWADDNTAYITGDGGLLCISTDGGFTWTPLNPGVGADLAGLALSGGAGYVFGAGGSGLSFGVPAQPVNLPPTIRIIEPVTNQQFFACYDIPITAIAGDPDGRVVKVEFFRGQFKLGETTRLQAAGRPFFSRFHTDVFGKYELRAVATDNLGASTISDPVTIEVIPPPLYTAVADGYSEAEGMSICYLGLVGSNYVLQATSELEVPLKWENLSTNQMPELLLRVLDPQATNRPLRYYRFLELR